MAEAAQARGLALAALAQGGRGGGGGFARDQRFVTPAERATGEGAAPFDPVADAWQRGYAEGVEAATQQAASALAAHDSARATIETALARMDADEAARFARRLKDTVLALCEAVLAEAALAPEALERRVAVAAAMFSRAEDERVIRLHPEDLALVQGRLPDAWHCEPDAGVERGAVLVETPHGGVEDGPTRWRLALEEALR
jgi:flagellar assembly protein FliH